VCHFLDHPVYSSGYRSGHGCKFCNHRRLPTKMADQVDSPGSIFGRRAKDRGITWTTKHNKAAVRGFGQSANHGICWLSLAAAGGYSCGGQWHCCGADAAHLMYDYRCVTYRTACRLQTSLISDIWHGRRRHHTLMYFGEDLARNGSFHMRLRSPYNIDTSYCKTHDHFMPLFYNFHEVKSRTGLPEDSS